MAKRGTLLGYFKANNIPSESNFKELIESALNQDDDGIKKIAGGPVAFQAQNANGELLQFFTRWSDPVPTWRIDQNPFMAGGQNAAGFSISEGKGPSRLFITSGTGEVGIGTAMPTATLDVQGTFGVRSTVDENSVQLSQVGATSTLNASGGFQLRVGGGASSFARRLSYYTAMTVLPTGNVGIGTATPADTLDVQGSLSIRNAAGGKALQLSHDGATAMLTNESGGLQMQVMGNGESPTSVRTVNAMTILTGGRVGIGTETPANRLEVQGTFGVRSAANANTLQLSHDGATATLTSGGAGGLQFQLRSATPAVAPGGPAVKAMTIKPSGDIGVGVENPGFKLDVNGSIRFGGFTTDFVDEWPKVVWLKDSTNNWDEGMVKVRKDRDNFNCPGFGIHMDKSKSFGFYSSGFIQLASIQGDSGNMYLKGALHLGPPDKKNPRGLIDVLQDGDICLVKDPDKGGVNSIFLPGHIYMAPHGGGNTSYLQARRREVTTGNTTLKIRTMTNGMASELEMTPDGDLKVKGKVYSGQTELTSDERLKKILRRSDGAEDLIKFNSIRVTDYTYLDSPDKVSREHKGVIAQELEDIYPGAVSKDTGFVPSILDQPQTVLAEDGILRVTMKSGHKLITGDRLRIFADGIPVEATVEIADENTFLVPGWNEKATRFFVYGKEVPDYRTVDYNSLFSLGLSATQELSRIIDKLSGDMASMQQQVEALNRDVASMQKRSSREPGHAVS